MTNPNLTAVALIADRSGSMEKVASDATGGIRNFIQEQKDGPGEAVFMLVQFDTEYEVVEDLKPIADVKANYTLRPRGATALYDAMGRTITDLGERLAAMGEDERPGKVIVVVVTDGRENSSVDWQRQPLFDLVERQKTQWNWEFIWLASDPTTVQVGRDMGTHAVFYVDDAVGTRAAYGAAGQTVNSFRAKGKVDESQLNTTSESEQ